MKIARVIFDFLIFASFIGALSITAHQIIWPRSKTFDDEFESFFDAHEHDEKCSIAIKDEQEEDEFTENLLKTGITLQVHPECIGDSAVKTTT